MMKKITFYLVVAFMLVNVISFAQGTITGSISDQELGGPLAGANLVEKGTNNGAISDFDGNFSITANSNSGTIEISYLGFVTKSVPFNLTNGKANLGVISMAADANALEEVVITGVVDFAKDRETPVAVSTIRSQEIIEKLGSQEFPEILKSTPSVYATKQGGGYGDARINIRGFDQRNTAVMINGVPVNDMESGWVYWSNWAGLSDVTSAIQVQRGLGSSKLAISSVGGTVNVITNPADKKEGGTISGSVGNDNYVKSVVSYNTGKMDSGLSASILFSRTSGTGYIDGTEFEGYNYYIAFGYQPNENHNFQFTYTAAPQWHNQNSRANSINDYLKYGGGDSEQGLTDEKFIKNRYNAQWGYLDGEVYTWRRNFYQKPVMSLNWDWDLNEKSSIYTVFYGSWGRGGGSGPIGKINGAKDYYGQFRNGAGQIRFDDIYAWNSGQSVPDFGDDRVPDADGNFINDRGNGFSRRASMNSHNWYGAVINFNHKLNEHLSFDIGTDLRSYKGYHFRVVNNTLGADGYFDNRDDFNPDRFIGPDQYESVFPNWNPWQNMDDMEKIEYYNEGLVRWAGLFGQIEYKNDALSAFLQFSGSSQGFQRIEHFSDLGPDESQETDWENILGGNIKGGANYNINEHHNVFVNAGYYSKQPLFDGVYINYGNNLNPELTNEKVLGTELGYGFRSHKFSANVNLYRTSWKDRYLTVGTEFDTTGDGENDTRGTANLNGVEQVHMGAELDFNYRPLDYLSFQGMVSYGDWQYNGDVTANYVDEDQNVIVDPDGGAYQETLYLDGVKVGDAAQFTARLGVTANVTKRFSVDGSVYYADNLYAKIDPTDFNFEDHLGSLELPSYTLTDLGMNYNLPMGEDKSLNFRVNVNNVFDELYISESATNKHAEAGDAVYDGINTANRVYFGFGRTWNVSVRLNF